MTGPSAFGGLGRISACSISGKGALRAIACQADLRWRFGGQLADCGAVLYGALAGEDVPVGGWTQGQGQGCAENTDRDVGKEGTTTTTTTTLQAALSASLGGGYPSGTKSWATGDTTTAPDPAAALAMVSSNAPL